MKNAGLTKQVKSDRRGKQGAGGFVLQRTGGGGKALSDDGAREKYRENRLKTRSFDRNR